ncbi:hypothetical protein [Vibrio bivalvicida]|uniref:Uncharacterized protein n=3 Tax=Vibrionaceae TaxID=641 RepID=A0A0H3ZP45_VIBSP|nr:hypothetical protein [Enterovibrio norvegicus]AKN38083.1 hypothetical protein [Vibrio splendidus]
MVKFAAGLFIAFVTLEIIAILSGFHQGVTGQSSLNLLNLIIGPIFGAATAYFLATMGERRRLKQAQTQAFHKVFLALQSCMDDLVSYKHAILKNEGLDDELFRFLLIKETAGSTKPACEVSLHEVTDSMSAKINFGLVREIIECIEFYNTTKDVFETRNELHREYQLKVSSLEHSVRKDISLELVLTVVSPSFFLKHYSLTEQALTILDRSISKYKSTIIDYIEFGINNDITKIKNFAYPDDPVFIPFSSPRMKNQEELAELLESVLNPATVK